MFSTDEIESGLTVKETAVLAGIPEKTIRHALASRVAQPGLVRRRPGEPRFRPGAVVFFRLVSSLPFELSLEAKRDLCELLSNGAQARGAWVRHGRRLLLRVKGAIEAELMVDPVEIEVARRLEMYRRGRERVTSSSDVLGGEPVFKGTRIAVRHVGELVRRGTSPADLHEDFPVLREEDLEFARLFVELGRPRGRPRKLKFRRANA